MTQEETMKMAAYAIKNKPKKSFKKWIFLSFIVLVIGALVVFFVLKNKHQQQEGEVSVVKKDNIELTVQEVGSVEPFRKVEIKSKVSGQVIQVLVDVGYRVQAGQVIMKLDPLDSERNLKQQQARSEITRAQLNQAQNQWTIKKKAFDSGVATESELVALDGDVKRLQAQLKSDLLQAEIARDQYHYTFIKSPIDGVVLARNVQPGEMVTPGVSALSDGKPLLVVAQIEKLLVRTELNQIDVARIHLKDKVKLQVDALPHQSFVGEIFRIAAMAQKSERRKDSNLLVFPVDVVVDCAQPGAQGLKPGMIADITTVLESKEQVLSIPLEALVRQDNKTKVWMVHGQGQKDSLEEVKIGIQNEQKIEIISGVKEGDKIRIRPALPMDVSPQG